MSCISGSAKHIFKEIRNNINPPPILKECKEISNNLKNAKPLKINIKETIKAKTISLTMIRRCSLGLKSFNKVIKAGKEPGELNNT